MSLHQRQAASMELTASARARQIVQRTFRDYPGRLAVRLWDGDTLNFGVGAPEVTLVVREPRLLRDLILFRDPLRVAEAYFQGGLDVEGDLYMALRMRDHLETLRLSAFETVDLLLAALFIGGASASVRSCVGGADTAFAVPAHGS